MCRVLAFQLLQLILDNGHKLVDSLENGIICLKVGMRPVVALEIVLRHAVLHGDKVLLVEILLVVDVHYVALPAAVHNGGVIRLLDQLFYGRFQLYHIVEVGVYGIRLDVQRGLARGLVLDIHYIVAEVARRRNALLDKRVRGGYSEHVHHKEEADAAYNVQKQEYCTKYRSRRIAHYAGEKSEQRYYRRGNYHRPVAPAQQQARQEHHHIYQVEHRCQQGFSCIKHKQRDYHRENRVHNGEFHRVHKGYLVKHQTPCKHTQAQWVRAVEYTYKKYEPFIFQKAYDFIHYCVFLSFQRKFLSFYYDTTI